MKILNERPPNFSEIERILHPPAATTFCYGDTIYNPSSDEVPYDVQFHESIHSDQQSIYSSPAIWWTQYLYDPKFRLEQELQAMNAQFIFVRKNISSEAAEMCITELAEALSRDYNIPISPHRAKTLIRKFNKK